MLLFGAHSTAGRGEGRCWCCWVQVGLWDALGAQGCPDVGQASLQHSRRGCWWDLLSSSKGRRPGSLCTVALEQWTFLLVLLLAVPPAGSFHLQWFVRLV